MPRNYSKVVKRVCESRNPRYSVINPPADYRLTPGQNMALEFTGEDYKYLLVPGGCGLIAFDYLELALLEILADGPLCGEWGVAFEVPVEYRGHELSVRLYDMEGRHNVFELTLTTIIGDDEVQLMMPWLTYQSEEISSLRKAYFDYCVKCKLAHLTKMPRVVDGVLHRFDSTVDRIASLEEQVEDSVLSMEKSSDILLPSVETVGNSGAPTRSPMILKANSTKPGDDLNIVDVVIDGVRGRTNDLSHAVAAESTPGGLQDSRTEEIVIEADDRLPKDNTCDIKAMDKLSIGDTPPRVPEEEEKGLVGLQPVRSEEPRQEVLAASHLADIEDNENEEASSVLHVDTPGSPASESLSGIDHIDCQDLSSYRTEETLTADRQARRIEEKKSKESSPFQTIPQQHGLLPTESSGGKTPKPTGWLPGTDVLVKKDVTNSVRQHGKNGAGTSAVKIMGRFPTVYLQDKRPPGVFDPGIAGAMCQSSSDNDQA